MSMPPVMASRPYDRPQLILKRKLLKMVGAQFHVHDAASGEEIGLAVQKGFKLKEDIRISFGGREEIAILARKVMDFSGVYDVVDLVTPGQPRLAVLRRKGLKSFVRDEWEILDAEERPIGTATEDNLFLGLIRRFVTELVPQNYDVIVGGQPVVDLKQGFNPLAYHLTVSFLVPPDAFDRRVGLAIAVALAALEGKQG